MIVIFNIIKWIVYIYFTQFDSFRMGIIISLYVHTEQSHLYQARKNKPRLSQVAHSKLAHFLIFVFMISTSIGQLVKAALRIKLKATMIE